MNPWSIIGWSIVSMMTVIVGIFYLFIFGTIFAATGIPLFHPFVPPTIVFIIWAWRRSRNRKRPEGRYVNRPEGNGVYDREERR
jgi:hypothetical protein